jgi:hypothetical protein
MKNNVLECETIHEFFELSEHPDEEVKAEFWRIYSNPRKEDWKIFPLVKSVTNIEEFFRTQIILPFMGALEDAGETNYSIEMIHELIKRNPEWWDNVKNRIWKCGFIFDHINHPIVFLLRK